MLGIYIYICIHHIMIHCHGKVQVVTNFSAYASRTRRVFSVCHFAVLSGESLIAKDDIGRHSPGMVLLMFQSSVSSNCCVICAMCKCNMCKCFVAFLSQLCSAHVVLTNCSAFSTFPPIVESVFHRP